ncbi:MAG: hypothetical protein J7J72_04400 [Bacteroidales bacterium]|nr:hypothetical protein [Bacteroidales bacterium]
MAKRKKNYSSAELNLLSLFYGGGKDTVLQKIIGVVNKTAPDSEVYLYGSQARGDQKNFLTGIY